MALEDSTIPPAGGQSNNPIERGYVPLQMDYQFIPQNPYTLTTDASSLGESKPIEGKIDQPSFLETYKAEAFRWNSTAQGIHAGYEKFEQVDPLLDIAPPDWTPKTNIDSFVNVKPENLGYLMAATGPKDQSYRLQRVYEQQADDDALANGSFVAKLLGGATGIVTDPMSYIPIAGWAKYGRLAPTILKSAGRALPGAATYAIASSAAEQADKINGNMHDFLLDSFTRTVFGTTLFAAAGVAGVTSDKMGLWSLRNFARGEAEGVDFKLATDAEGKITGYKAIDSTGDLSAAKVSYYQDLADSSFAKTGIFKIPGAIADLPLVGASLEKLGQLPYAKEAGELSGYVANKYFEYFGSPLSLLLSSPFKTVRGFIDRVADHSIITEGVLKGQAAPKKFGSLMNQTASRLRALSVQMDALHLERNGFDINNRHLGGLVNLGLNLKDKGLKLLSKDLDKEGYVSKDAFFSEVEHVLVTENKSDHAAVNDAANMLRKHMDESYVNFRKAYNLPEDWLPPKTAQGYLTRVYDTAYMNTNKDRWIGTISNWLKEADETITQRMEPINALQDEIKDFESKHTQAVEYLANMDKARIASGNNEAIGIEHGITINGAEKVAPSISREIKPGSPEYTLRSMKLKLRAIKEALQNELRVNPDLQLHVEDWNALSADEAKELQQILSPTQKLEKEVAEQKKALSQIKAETNRKLSAAKNETSIKKAVPKSKKYVENKDAVLTQEEKLREVQDKLEAEKDRLQALAHQGEINPRYFTKSPDSFSYKFKDTSDRLRFRETYESHAARETHASAYYDTILNQTAEDTINQIMGRYTGNQKENPVKARTLLVPDNILYENNFMTKDLMAKVSNYTNYLSRRTHVKSVFNDVTFDEGVDPIVRELKNEFSDIRAPLDKQKSEIQEKLSAKDISASERKKLEDRAKLVDKDLVKVTKQFEHAKDSMNHLYEKMMGFRKYSKGAEQMRSVVMSLTSMGSLAFVPFTMITDLSAVGLQHGIWPFLRDGIYPIVESLGGLRKSKDSEAFRKTAPSIHLALQDVLNGYSDRNWGMHTNPYLNKGRIVNNLERFAHFSANVTLTNYIDNALQRITSSVTQSELMRILHDYKGGTMSKRDGLYIRKYGIDPKKWSDRMITAFEQNGGGKTKLGGYQSQFWQWQDMEAANEFSAAVYRGVKDTQIQQGIADSPFWTDNPLGSIIKGFSGWMFASVNRYVIPTMQQPDAQKLLGVMFMLGAGALVDPMRRMARGEEPYPANVTDKQKLWSAINNSGYFSFFANAISDANLLTGDRLLGDLKSDKYKDRTRAGLLGPAWGSFNRLVDVIGAAGTGEWNKADMNKAARMVPLANSTWTYWMSKKLIDSLHIPENRRQAHALKELSQ